jgi:acyl-coenzyme A synthetase/AMP-(fatty) acid ligase
LRALGVTAGRRFGVLMPNGPEIVEFLLGAAFVGATMVPIKTRFKPHELGHVIADAELTSVITTGAIDGVVDFVELLHETLDGLAGCADPGHLALPGLPQLRTVAVLAREAGPGLVGLDGVAPELADVDERMPQLDDPFLIMYTSGTTALVPAAGTAGLSGA